MTDRSPAPPPLVHLEDTGLAPDVIEQLLLKTLYGAEAIGSAIAEQMRLPFTMLEPLIEHARAERLDGGARRQRRQCRRRTATR